jgi:hypothetical protein
MSFYPDLVRCRKTDRFPGTVLVAAALNSRVKRKIRTDADGEYAEEFWPGF